MKSRWVSVHICQRNQHQIPMEASLIFFSCLPCSSQIHSERPTELRSLCETIRRILSDTGSMLKNVSREQRRMTPAWFLSRAHL
jgi:hypothetical protein